MSRLVEIGGVTPLMKRLLAAGLLHGDVLTVTGKTMAENLESVADYPNGQDIILPFETPIKATGHLVICYGNIAPQGSVAKLVEKKDYPLLEMHVCITLKKPLWLQFWMAQL